MFDDSGDDSGDNSSDNSLGLKSLLRISSPLRLSAECFHFKENCHIIAILFSLFVSLRPRSRAGREENKQKKIRKTVRYVKYDLGKISAKT
jgi:hypothetical protein